MFVQKPSRFFLKRLPGIFLKQYNTSLKLATEDYKKLNNQCSKLNNPQRSIKDQLVGEQEREQKRLKQEQQELLEKEKKKQWDEYKRNMGFCR